MENNKYKNRQGQSLIDVIFSIGIIVLVLTGVVVLIVSTAKVKRLAFERKKAVELSQILMERKILEIKNNPLLFWESIEDKVSFPGEGSDISSDFSGYKYTMTYENCDTGSEKCTVVFKIDWEDNTQSLSIERLFLRQGT